jgi:predicted nucleotidyltransferase
MRLKENIREFFVRYVKEHFLDARVYLFGSRVDDYGKGGDIDILIISREKLSFTNLSLMRTNFCKIFGEQKLDVINFTVAEKDPFKEIALNHAIEL